MTDETTTSTTPAPAAPAMPQTAPVVAPPKLFDPRTSSPSSGRDDTSDPAKMTPSQVAARQAMDELRPQTLGDPVAARKFREAMRHVYGDEPAPDWLLPAKTAPENQFPHESGLSAADVGSIYEPASQPSEYKLTKGARLPDDLLSDPQTANEILEGAQEMLHEWKLPPGFGSEILGRIMHHSKLAQEDGSGNRTTYLSGDFLQAVREESDRVLAGNGGLDKTLAQADAYLRATLTAQQYAEFEQTVKRGNAVASIALDPLVLLRLASLAKARGHWRE